MTGAAYGWEHQQARAALRAEVEAGETDCAEPICLYEEDGEGRRILSDDAWDLAHDRDHGGYHGPAHRRCNRAEGARWRQVLAGIRDPDPTPGAWPL